MARPKKLSTEKMVQIVNSYFENNSDPNRLKCNLLEEYAVSLGIEVKAYDFRRNAVVRERMNELKNSENQEGVMAIAYKS